LTFTRNCVIIKSERGQALERKEGEEVREQKKGRAKLKASKTIKYILEIIALILGILVAIKELFK